jgi:hypothetical protein
LGLGLYIEKLQLTKILVKFIKKLPFPYLTLALLLEFGGPQTLEDTSIAGKVSHIMGLLRARVLKSGPRGRL